MGGMAQEPAAAANRRAVRCVEPKARLVAWTHDPYGIAVASARTCYAPDFVYVGRLTPKGERRRLTLAEAFPEHAADLAELGDPRTPQARRDQLVAALLPHAPDEAAREAMEAFCAEAARRGAADDRIAKSIYEAGHHTPFQHPTFVFALEDVSRNVVESFLHQHTFYNSEQQSQRYVRMDDAAVHVPAAVAADPAARRVYEDAVRRVWDAYHSLCDRLVGPNLRTMAAIGRLKGQTEKQVASEAQKKSQEMARYVVPVGAATRLYHTVSGIVLLRYLRMAEAQHASQEARILVERMVDAVREAEPAFFERIQEEPLPRDAHVEWRLAGDAPYGPAVDLAGRTSLLLHTTPEAGRRVAQSVRETTGSRLDDPGLIAEVMDPGRNPVWNDTLNTWDHSTVLRSLRHVHCTFHKRQSLAAYAQDQRHRMTPATRPLLTRLLPPGPGQDLDVYVPDVVERDPQALQEYRAAVAALRDAIVELRDRHGVPEEDCTYLLPNACNLYYTQSGDLLSWIHKWRLRLCFNAQKEIFDAALDELRQVQEAHPELTAWLGPPCTFVAAAQPPELQDSVEACCPEGPRWCGVKVWKGFDAAKGRPRRPY